MKNFRPLPAREPPLSDESLTSLLRRTAAAMGYDYAGQITKLLKQVETVPPQLNRLSPGPTLDRLGRLLNLPTTRLVQGTVHRFAENLVLVGKTDPPATVCDSKPVLRFFNLAHPPICPQCFAEDKIPFERLAWSLRALPICLRHQVFLASVCPVCRRRLRPTRTATWMCSCGADVRSWSYDKVSSYSLHLFEQIDRWLGGEATALPGTRSCANFWWMERLASAVARTPNWLERINKQFEIPQAAGDVTPWIAAAEILVNWPQAFCEFLEVYQQVTKYRTSDTGVARSFGLLLREANQLEDLGYAAPADALREFLLDHYTAGQLSAKVCLFDSPRHARLLRKRPWITLTEADKLLGLRSGASADLVQQGVLQGRLQLAGMQGRRIGVVARGSARQLAGELQTATSVNEASSVLGIGRSRVFELIRAGLLPRSVRTVHGWRIPRASVDELLSLYRQLPLLKRSTPSWLEVQAATRRFGPCGLSLGRLLRLVQEQRVDARRTSGSDNFNGLRVSALDLQSERSQLNISRSGHRGFSLHKVAKALFPTRPMKETILKKWIAAGLLRAVRRGRRWVILPDEIERFRTEYCLFSEAIRVLDVDRKTLGRWEAEGHIRPVYGRRTTRGAGFSLYRRADIESLQAQRATGGRRWRAA